MSLSVVTLEAAEAEYGFPSTHVLFVAAQVGLFISVCNHLSGLSLTHTLMYMVVVGLHYIWTYYSQAQSAFADIDAQANTRFIIYLFCIGTVLVASTFFGRVYYGVHSFVDVIGGTIL